MVSCERCNEEFHLRQEVWAPQQLHRLVLEPLV